MSHSSQDEKVPHAENPRDGRRPKDRRPRRPQDDAGTSKKPDKEQAGEACGCGHDHGRESSSFISPDCPPEIAEAFLSNDWCPYCSDRPPKKLKDHFSPPLEPFDPDTVPDDKVAETLEAWRTRLIEKNFVVEGCEHCTPRDLLKRIAEALEEEFVEMKEGTWHLTVGEECEECFKKWEHEEATFDWKKRVLDEVGRVRETLEELEAFFEKADAEIAANEADPRGALGRITGLDRLMPLVPCVLARLEEDIIGGHFSLPLGGEGGEARALLAGLEAVDRAIRAAYVWYERDDVDWAVQLANAAFDGIRKSAEANTAFDRLRKSSDGNAAAAETHPAISGQESPCHSPESAPSTAPPAYARAGGNLPPDANASRRTSRRRKARFFRDLARISGDIELLRGQLDDFRENRDRRPIWVEDAEVKSKERWAEYYREQAMREEPIISIVEMEGLSRESLEKGLRLQEEQSKKLESQMEDTVRRHRLEESREAAFDPENPALFLDLPAIPEAKEDEAEPERAGHSGEFGLGGAWSESLPELAKWEMEEMEREADTDDIGDGKTYNHRDDPVFKMIDPFLHGLMEAERKASREPSRDRRRVAVDGEGIGGSGDQGIRGSENQGTRGRG